MYSYKRVVARARQKRSCRKICGMGSRDGAGSPYVHGGARQPVMHIGATLAGSMVVSAMESIPAPNREKGEATMRNSHYDAGPIICPAPCSNFVFDAYVDGSVERTPGGRQRNIYHTELSIKPLPEKERAALLRFVQGDAALYKTVEAMDPHAVQKILRSDAGKKLIPGCWGDVATAKCECKWFTKHPNTTPVPRGWCKHIAACWYHLACECDRCSYLVLKLRGVNVETLKQPARAPKRARADPGQSSNYPIEIGLD